MVAVDRPRSDGGDADIRFLDSNELEALIRAVPDDTLGGMERVLYLAAAMTGLRQGELVALRWRDIDWAAGLLRVRRSYTRGSYGKPKSRRSSRAVPLADRIAAELERHFQRSNYQADDDLGLLPSRDRQSLRRIQAPSPVQYGGEPGGSPRGPLP